MTSAEILGVAAETTGMSSAAAYLPELIKPYRRKAAGFVGAVTLPSLSAHPNYQDDHQINRSDHG